MALGEARVEIIPDVSGFEKALVSAVEDALGSAKSAADSAASDIAGSFDSAATEAEASLSSVDGGGFAEASAAADAAGSEVSGAFDAASSQSDAALASVDGGGFAEATGAAESAGVEITQTMEQAASDTQRAFENLDLGKTLQGAFAGAAVLGFTKSLLGAAEAGAQARARVDQIASSMALFGDDVQQVTDRLADLADATARQTGVDDDSILATQAKLLTFRQLAATADEVGGAFDRATLAALDLAAAGFGSAESNAVQLGKALQDPIKGITALARAGVTFTESEKERIRVLVESNQIGEAQTLVLSALEQQVGGTAAATATASEKMRVSFDQAAEAAGGALLPAMQMLADTVGKAAEIFLSLPEPLQKTITLAGLGAAGFYAASRALQGLGAAAATANKSLGAIGLVISGAIAVYQVYTNRKEEARQVTLGLAGALDLEGEAQNDALVALAENDAAVKRFLITQKSLGVTTRDVAEYVRLGTGRLEDMATASLDVLDAVQGTLPELAALAEEVLGVSLAGDDYLEKSRNMTQAQVESAAAARDFFLQLEELRTGEINAAEAAEVVRAAIGGFTESTSQAIMTTETFEERLLAGRDAMLRQQEATNIAEQALWDLLNATLSSFNSQLGLENQMRSVSDAVGEYTATAMQAVAGTLDAEDAARAVAEAQNQAAGEALTFAAAAAKVAEDQAKASGSTLTAAESARIQRDALQQVANTLDPNSPLRKQLQGYIDELENQIPRDIETNLTAKVNISGNALQFIRTGQINRTANGGVFDTPQTRLIAEAGREAVIPITRPARAIELLESSGLANLVRGQGSGPAVMIQSATFQDATDADLVAQRVNTALRVRSFAG